MKITKAIEPWKVRMMREYAFVKTKYEKLHRMIVKYEAGVLDFKPNCSLEILKKQAAAMGSYLYILEMRAEIEDVELPRQEFSMPDPEDVLSAQGNTLVTPCNAGGSDGE